MVMEKKSLVGKKTSASPAPRKTQTTKAKVDTGKPAASKVVAALKVGIF